MCDMVTLDGNGNVVEPENRISTSMPSALDIWTSNSIKNIFLPWVVHVCDMMALDRKDNVLEPGN
jgi:hypothetical protein